MKGINERKKSLEATVYTRVNKFKMSNKIRKINTKLEEEISKFYCRHYIGLASKGKTFS